MIQVDALNATFSVPKIYTSTELGFSFKPEN